MKRCKFQIKAGNYSLDLGIGTKIMGIMNMTPDSFSGDGLLTKKTSPNQILNLARKLINDGVDIIDIGGESTRPGSQKISAKEEIRRVIPSLKLIAKSINAPVSIDSYKPEVIQAALDSGAVIVNNIMGVKANNRILKMVKNYNAAIVLMHIQGTPKNMQKNVSYKDLIAEIIIELRKSIEKCFEIGIKSDRIIIDPGICFGKTIENNLEIINRLNEFNCLKHPILIGTSRKSFIGKVLNKETNKRLFGTIASICVSIINGAHIVRVHDVKEAKEAIIITDSVINKKPVAT